MPSALAPSTLPRRARVARAATIALALVMLGSVTAYGWTLATSDPASIRGHHAYVGEGDDYLVWMRTFGHLSYTTGWWHAHVAPDRVMVVREGDVDRLLAGEEPREVLHELTVQEMAGTGVARGDVLFRNPSADCSRPGGGCIPETVPVLVWMRGDAWVGADRSDARYGYWNLDHPTAEESGAPVHFTGTRVFADVIDHRPWALGIAGVAAAGALASAGVWVFSQPRRRLVVGEEAGASEGGSAEDSLHALRLTTLYVGAIQRSFASTAILIVLGTLALMFFGLPPMVDAIARQLQHTPFVGPVIALYVLTAPFLGVVAFAFWFADFRQVREELKRWRALTEAFEEDAARILAR